MFKKILAELKKRNNGMFWVTATAQLLLAIQVILAIFGKQDLLDQALQHRILAAVEAVITFLGTIGVFINPLSLEFRNDTPSNPVIDVPVSPIVDVPVKEDSSTDTQDANTVVTEPADVPSVEVPTEPADVPSAEVPTEPVEVEPIQGPIVTTEQTVVSSVTAGPTIITDHDIKPGPINQ